MKFLLPAALLLLPTATLAQQTPTFGCNAPEARQFDFWVGSWNVVNASGQSLGTNRIEVVEGGCALQENWTGARGGTGRSLNFFERGEWHQVWVANNPNGVLRLKGGLRNGAMVMTGTSTGPQAATIQNRVTWTPLPGGELRQHWETSTDGTTWQTTFDGRYVRQPVGDSAR